MEKRLKELEEKYKELQQKVLHLEFRQDLLMCDTNTNRVLLDYNITKEQYESIMDVMDEIRDKLSKNPKEVNNADFETKVEAIVNRQGDYHFCEYIAKAFMDDDRWEEVFQALYGDMPKYKYLKENRND